MSSLSVRLLVVAAVVLAHLLPIIPLLQEAGLEMQVMLAVGVQAAYYQGQPPYYLT